ncbi:MAG: glycosyltransferase family 4 protein [Chloroflexota bacterium]
MSAPLTGDPCLDVPVRQALPAESRIGVVQLVASGTNGGAQEHVYGLLTQIDRSRYDVRVISLSDGSAVRRWRSLGVPVEVVAEADDASAAVAVADLLTSWGTQVVHGHMYRAEIVGVLALDRIAARGLPRPWFVTTVHSSRLRSVEDRELLAEMTPRIDRVIAVSRSIIEKLEHEGRMSERVRLIYNGVDLGRYDHQEACCTLPEEYGFAPGTPMVGVIGRLEPEKGQATLIDAWPLVLERVPAARLLVVGEGSCRDALEAQAEAHGLLGDACSGDACVGTRHARPNAKVVFTGRRDDVPAVTAALDVAVLPSYREAQGLVILEAMALSRPVVASDVGGIPEMITDGITGLLVPPHDPPALAAAIVRLLTDHPLADMIARAAHDMVHQRFCIEVMGAAIQDLYDEGETAWPARVRAAEDQRRTVLQ